MLLLDAGGGLFGLFLLSTHLRFRPERRGERSSGGGALVIGGTDEVAATMPLLDAVAASSGSSFFSSSSSRLGQLLLLDDIDVDDAMSGERLTLLGRSEAIDSPRLD